MHMRKCKKRLNKTCRRDDQKWRAAHEILPRDETYPLRPVARECASMRLRAGREGFAGQTSLREGKAISQQAGRRNPSGPIRRACALWLVLPSRNPSFTDSADRPHSLTFEYVAPRRKVKPRNQRRRSGGGEEGRHSNDTHASRARRPLICLISACGGKYDRTSGGANAKTPPES